MPPEILRRNETDLSPYKLGTAGLIPLERSVSIQVTESSGQHADILTKSLGRDAFGKHRLALYHRNIGSSYLPCVRPPGLYAINPYCRGMFCSHYTGGVS